MKFEIVTIFPDYFSLSLRQSLIGKAWARKLLDIDIIDLRDFATDKHRTVDDAPFGGGGGMVMKVEPLDRCLQALGYDHKHEESASDVSQMILITSAAGKKLTQDRAVRYSLCDRLTIICGHYLGVDQRIMELYDIEAVCIGDYVLTGGEPAAAVIVDAVARLIPKVLGNFGSATEDSFMDDLLGAPGYTRPAEYMGLSVPEELLSGDHTLVKTYHRREAIKRCVENRPDLLETADLTDEEREFVVNLTRKERNV
jgi:tRNA (guanine37-N1)-methyltransferase